MALAALLRLGAAPAVLAFGLTALPAFAQAAPPTQDEVDQAAAEEPDDAIVVTGSLFRRTDTETPSPVTMLTDVALDRAGVTTISDGAGDNFCYVRPFINNDLNLTITPTENFSFYMTVKNLFDVRAPVAPAAYASAPNFLTTWHYAGLIGRNFRVGANFSF